MEKVFSTFFILFSFFLASCSAPATGSISHTRPSGSGGIQLPDSFQDIRWADWRGYDENYQYFIYTATNGTLTWSRIAVDTLPLHPSFSISTDAIPANTHDRSMEFSGVATGYYTGDNWQQQEVRHQLHARLEADPNWLEGTLYLEVNPDLNSPVSKIIRMRRDLY